MIKPRDGEKRIDYLARVLYEFMESTSAGECIIEYDEAHCDGYCLAQDFIDELGVDVDDD